MIPPLNSYSTPACCLTITLLLQTLRSTARTWAQQLPTGEHAPMPMTKGTKPKSIANLTRLAIRFWYSYDHVSLSLSPVSQQYKHKLKQFQFQKKNGCRKHHSNKAMDPPKEIIHSTTAQLSFFLSFFPVSCCCGPVGFKLHPCCFHFGLTLGYMPIQRE